MVGAGGGDLDAASADEKKDNILKGRTLLCLVALLYGTLNVSLRLVYQLPDAPTAAALSATRGWLATMCFVPLILSTNNSNKNKEDAANANANTPVALVQQEDDDTTKSVYTTPLLVAGLELAVWNFLAQGLLNVGLLSTGSARASFLTQTSVVLTPIISLLAGQSIPSTVWMGCGVALMGLTLLSGGASGLAGVAFSTGDWLVLGGALSWSLYLFRLSKIATNFESQEIPLQAVKTALLAVLYSVWFATSWSDDGTMLLASSWMTNPLAWAALLYSAVGPGMLADVLQQKGQSLVSSASEANVILSMEPVFAAVCARLFMGEITSWTETIGGGLILVAALIATMTGDSSSSSES
jgi:drug/metabolite transporter (DMT)-like permease